MTLQEAKDQVAKKHRFNDWEDVILQFQAKNHVDEVAELYAQQFKDKADKWDALDAKIGKAYEEDSESDLVDIGEFASEAFGYL